MLSRYRSVARLEMPRGSRAARFNNPVQQLEEAAEFRMGRLRDNGGGLGDDSLKMVLRLWDGPLAGIAHQAGQFPALQEGPTGEAAPASPADLIQALSLDLELLMRVSELTQDVLYDASGSESEFAVVPIILEPRLAAAPSWEECSADSCSGGGDDGTGGQQQPRQTGVPVSVSVVGGGAGGGWWSLADALAVPLTWDEAAASLGIAPELAALMQPPQVFRSQEEFWSHMLQRHISKLAGGAPDQDAGQRDEGERDAGRGGHQQLPPGPGPAAARIATAGEGAAGAAPVIPGGDLATQQSQPREPLSAAGALEAAVRELCEAVAYPALQVALGSEALGWNPIPLLWLGRSRRSGAILGLMTAVVWT